MATLQELQNRLTQAKIDRQVIDENISDLEDQIKVKNKTYKPGDTITNGFEKAVIYRIGRRGEVVLVSPDGHFVWSGHSFIPNDVNHITREELNDWGFYGYK